MPFKFAFIGQDIPMHLPFLLVDFLYAGKEDGILAVEEKNAAMRDVLQHYAEAIVYASGRKSSWARTASFMRATAWRRRASGRIRRPLAA